MHRILLPDVAIPDPGQTLAITGEEAVHAIKVKRLEPGESVQVMDGAGAIGAAHVDEVIRAPRGREGPTLVVRISARTEVPFPGIAPALEVYTATPKGGRVDDLVDAISQLGAASWSPLHTSRSVVDPRDAKLARLERIAREAAKQCGRAWVMRIGEARSLGEVLGAAGGDIILADASGAPAEIPAPPPHPSRPLRLLIGPEGGWTPEELAAASAAGARVTRFGPHTLRIETAALAASAILLARAEPIAHPAT